MVEKGDMPDASFEQQGDLVEAVGLLLRALAW